MALLKDYDYKLIYTNEKLMFQQNTESMFSKIPKTIEEKITIEKAYFQITKLSGSKQKIEFDLEIFKDDKKEFLIDVKNYSFVPSVEDTSYNFIKQGYEYLKNLPDFHGAIDC